MRRCVAILLAFLLVPLGTGTASPAPAPAPRLAVILVVDGLSWERLRSWRPWFNSGFARLLDEGAVATECRFDHLNTETAPGHASIATGAPPRVHGVPLNQWYAPSADGKSMETIYSAAQPVGGAPSTPQKTEPGPGRILVPTLGDRLTAKDARAKIVAISNKDRAAILMAGRDTRHAAYWYSSKNGRYVTSAAYDVQSPVGAAVARIVAGFNAADGGDKLGEHAGTVWARLPLPNPLPEPGYEIGLSAFQDTIVGPEFPHDLAKAKRPLPAAILWAAAADTLLTDLAIDLLDDQELALGRDDVPDVLGVSFSANDYVSHFYGPESVEDLEVLRSLDRSIGRLLDELAAKVGKDGAVVALSSDHGFLPLPEATRRRDPQAPGRVPDVRILEELNSAVNAGLSRNGGTPLVYRLEGCSLWLDRVALAAPGAPTAERVLAIVQKELATTWKAVIKRAVVLDPEPKRGHDDLSRRAWNAYAPGRSGDLFVVPRYGVLVDPYGGVGSSHGTPWEYDTHVPLLFWGGAVAKRRISNPTSPYDLAPTLAARLGVDLPDATGNRLKIWREQGSHR